MNNVVKPRPVAVWPVCAGLGVYAVEVSDERVVWRWSNEKKLHTSKISEDRKSGRAYVRVNRYRYWLDEAVRT